jgi:hypothetical protein
MWIYFFCKISDTQNIIEGKTDIMIQLINPSRPELNSSAQRRLTRFFTGDFILEPCILLIYA